MICFGGPLDGQPPPVKAFLGFPWPGGWYYFDMRNRFVWRDQPGTFLQQDVEWLMFHGVDLPRHIFPP